MRPQELVERALELLGPDRGTVLVEHTTSANLRWANSTLTTNGMTAQQRVHIVAHPEVPGGIGSGTTSAVVRTADDLGALIAQARAEALGAGPAQDAAPEVPARPGSPTWDLAPDLSAPEELAPVSALLSEVLPATDIDHFGYAEHSVTSSYLGTTSGLRLRHDQPAARFELCGKSGGRHAARPGPGRSGRHFAEMDLAGTPAEVRRGLAAQATHIDVAPGRQRVLLSPVGGGRHAHLPAVVGRCPRRRRGPQRLQPARGRHPRG